MPAAAADKSFTQRLSERLNGNGIEAHQRHVTERSREFARIVEFRLRGGGHGSTSVKQQPHRDAGLNLEHFQEQLFQAHIGAPVHRAQVVTVMEMAMIEELLAAAREMRAVVPPNQTGEG